MVGAGLAGLRLATRLVQAGADVTVIGEEPYAPYNRVLLAGVLSGRYPADVVTLPDPGCLVRLGVRACALDRAARTVRCADGTTLGYDTLVLATGSNPVLPPLRGITAEGPLPEGVHPFRTMRDCLALSRAAAPGVPAVVVGGGLLGVSAARALAERGTRVVLAQQGSHLMERHLDEEAAALLRAHLEDSGVEVHTECRVRGLATTGGRVRAVRLADGHELDAELVVLACGVRPRTGLARAAGLEVANGIVVDDALRTGDPHIHAVGDCAEHDGVVYGLAGAAHDQADLLARVLTGDGGPGYPGTRALTRLTLPGPGTPFDMAAFGAPKPAAGDDVVRITDATRGTYRQVVLRGDRLVGGILLGDLGSVATLARAWEGAEPVPSHPAHLLTDDGGSCS